MKLLFHICKKKIILFMLHLNIQVNQFLKDLSINLIIFIKLNYKKFNLKLMIINKNNIFMTL